MKQIDKNKLIKFLDTRIKSFQYRIEHDFGAGLNDDLGRYREAKVLKKFLESGKFDVKDNT